MPPRLKTAFRRWPFWLLIAAWACATAPASLPVHVCAWLRDARHFSHSATLRQDVQALLRGKTSPRASVLATSIPSRPAPFSPAAPEAAKKIDLALAGGPGRWCPPVSPPVWSAGVVREPRPPVAEVPHPPPRCGRTA